MGLSGNQVPKKALLLQPSEYSFRLQFLKGAMRVHEEITRTNSGSRNGGLRIADGATFEFAKFALEAVWAELFLLKTTNPAEYERVSTFQKGQYWPVKINCAHYAAISKFSRSERAAFKQTSPQAKYGSPAALKNASRTIYNLRRKLTCTEQIEHANGNKSEGFNLFQKWMGIDPHGNECSDGRSGCIGYINLEFVFGRTFVQVSENEAVAPVFSLPDMEYFSPILPIEKNKKIENSKISGIGVQPLNAENIKTNLENTELIEDQKDVETIPVNLPQESSELTKKLAAIRVWAFIMARIYVPMLAEKRVRFAKSIYTRAEFSVKTEQNAILQIEVLLSKWTEEQLHQAAQQHAEWMERNKKTYVYAPISFLNADYSAGTIITAMRELGERSEILVNDPNMSKIVLENEDKLYDWMLRLGATKIRLFTFRNWINKYGEQYMKDMLKIFQDKIHARRAKGYVKGKEYPDHSRTFAKLVYYGTANHAEMQEKRKVELRIKLRSEANSPIYSQYYPQMATMTVDEMRVLNSLCKEAFNISFSTKKEVLSNTHKAVLFAYLINQQKNN
jgi:hypothetical protein